MSLAPLILPLIALFQPLQAPLVEEPAICATGRGTELTELELDELLILRHGRSPRGREILQHLLEGRMVDAIAAERDVRVKEEELKARVDTLEEQVKRSGEAESLEAYLKASGVNQVMFYEYMRLAVLQEQLTRLSVGIPEGTNVTGEQQRAWLEGEIAERGVTEEEPPFQRGVVLTCPPIQIKTPEFLTHLRSQLPPEELKETCYHLLLAKRVRARLPDLSPAEIARAIEAEVARRRSEAEADPSYAGVSFERLLASQGLTPASLAKDPSVLIAALSGLYVDRVYGEDGLRAAYNTDRDYFDGNYGEALGVRVLFLRAARFTNDFIPRTFEMAESDMQQMLSVLESEEEFLAVSQARSEAQGELAKGALHWMPKLDKQVRSDLVAAAFDRWGGLTELPEDPKQRLLGPTRTPKGCVLLWLSSRRPAPAWELMAQQVRQDMRRRFVEDTLKPSEVTISQGKQG